MGSAAMLSARSRAFYSFDEVSIFQVCVSSAGRTCCTAGQDTHLEDLVDSLRRGLAPMVVTGGRLPVGGAQCGGLAWGRKVRVAHDGKEVLSYSCSSSIVQWLTFRGPALAIVRVRRRTRRAGFLQRRLMMPRRGGYRAIALGHVTDGAHKARPRLMIQVCSR